jgi:hypothetical protein
MYNISPSVCSKVKRQPPVPYKPLLHNPALLSQPPSSPQHPQCASQSPSPSSSLSLPLRQPFPTAYTPHNSRPSSSQDLDLRVYFVLQASPASPVEIWCKATTLSHTSFLSKYNHWPSEPWAADPDVYFGSTTTEGPAQDGGFNEITVIRTAKDYPDG